MKTQAPDVDGVVYVNDGIRAKPARSRAAGKAKRGIEIEGALDARAGDIVPVKISEAHSHDLVGGITRGARDRAPEPRQAPAKAGGDGCEPEHHDLERAGGHAKRTRVGLIIS